MSDKEFMNVTRSTLPLISYWMDRGLAQSQSYHFEYTVPSVARARPSHTDLMIIGSQSAEAVEGKSTEPRYETVGEWMARPGALKPATISHWIGLISKRTHSAPDIDQVSACVYQMVHRLASVCWVDRPVRILTYQLFDLGADHGSYLRDLQHLSRVFGLEEIIEVSFHRVETRLTDVGMALRESLTSLALTSRAAAVRGALLDRSLFKFGDEKTEAIT